MTIKKYNGTSKVGGLQKELKNRFVPAAQAVQYTTERALETLVWLEETEAEWQKKYNARKDGYKTRLRTRILSDIVSVYISTLVEENGSGHSLLKSYAPDRFTAKFAALPIVKECKVNRHNRSGHESRSYGHFVSPKDILSSNLKSWLDCVLAFIAITPEKDKALRSNNKAKHNHMDEYSSKEITEICQILNTKFLKNTGYFCNKLDIKIRKMREWSSDENGEAREYVVDCILQKDSIEVFSGIITQFTNKDGVQNAAFVIAYWIWERFDKSDTSQLWKNFSLIT